VMCQHPASSLSRPFLDHVSGYHEPKERGASHADLSAVVDDLDDGTIWILVNVAIDGTKDPAIRRDIRSIAGATIHED